MNLRKTHFHSRKWFSGEMLGAQKQKPKKQPFSDASASHLSLVLRHV